MSAAEPRFATTPLPHRSWGSPHQTVYVNSGVVYVNRILEAVPPSHERSRNVIDGE